MARPWMGTRRRSPRRPRSDLGPKLRSMPPLAWALSALVVLAVANSVVQAARKPTELLALVARPAPKDPPATWARYGPLFREHSTDVMRPELLAALVQVESAGDPLARTYWRWRWSANPFEIYAPASSAVGILQITDATFAEARRYCIHDHEVARDGSWLDPRTCWFNALYFRTIPSHAIEMTSARLHQTVVDTLAALRIPRATLAERQRLAAVVQLCGRERGAAFARRGFVPRAGERCGDHALGAYVSRVERLKLAFARMAQAP